MKVAWLVCTGPRDLVRGAAERLEVIADTYLSLNAPTQFAVPVLLEQRHSLQKQLLDRVQTNRSELIRQLSAQTICELLDADGGWYAVLRVPADQPDEERILHLIREQNVIVHPGHFFDFPTDGFLVLSLITPAEDFCEGVQRLLASF
jgi:aspartate/methionine/tyrosine aminotransferase